MGILQGRVMSVVWKYHTPAISDSVVHRSEKHVLENAILKFGVP